MFPDAIMGHSHVPNSVTAIMLSVTGLAVVSAAAMRLGLDAALYPVRHSRVGAYESE